MPNVTQLFPIRLFLLSTLALTSHSLATENTNFGTQAGANQGDTANQNVNIGENAGSTNVYGDYTTMIGYNAGTLNTGSDNTFVGANAGESNTTGTDNTFIGARTGQLNTATDNTFIGSEAGKVNTTGADNVFVGEQAGYSNTDGDDNTFVGEDAGYNNTLGDDNTAVGNNALKTNSVGKYNTTVGSGAGYDIGYARSGEDGVSVRNTAVGNSAGYDIGMGNANTMIGDNAGPNTEYADFSTFVGFQAGFDNNRTNNTHDANRNTAVGAYAGYTNRQGEDNVWIGALSDSTVWNFDQDGEVAYLRGENGYTPSAWDPGYDKSSRTAYNSSTSNAVSRTTVIGANASARHNDSLVLGYKAHSENSFGVVIGSNAQGTKTGNIVIGDSANSTGTNSITIGRNATSTHTEAVTIGYGAVSHADYAVVLGNANTLNWEPSVDAQVTLGAYDHCDYDNDYNWVCEGERRFKDVVSQQFTVSSNDTEDASIELYADHGDDYDDHWALAATDGGHFTISTYAHSTSSRNIIKTPLLTLNNEGNMTLAGGLTLNSDRRLKKDIQTINNPLAKITQIEGKTYYWKPELGRESQKQYGLIAQNVEAIIPELVHTDDDENETKSVNYQAMIPVLIEAIKAQQTQIDALQTRLKHQQDLEQQINALKQQLNAKK